MKGILKNWKTTLAGIVSIVLLVLVNSGTISPNESQELDVVIGTLITHVDGIIGAIIAIGLIISKDADKE